MINDIYNKEVLRLAADISRIDPLETPDAHVSLRSPLCGSTIEIDLKINDGRVTDFGQTIKACALGQAAASVLARVIVGKSAEEIRRVRDQLEAMLKTDGVPPNGEWAALAALVPAKAATSRHGAILLPFDAVLKAMEEAKAGAAA